MDFITDLKTSKLITAFGLEIPYDYILYTFIDEDFLRPYEVYEPSTFPEPHLGDNGHNWIPDEDGAVRDLIGEHNIEELVEYYLEELEFTQEKKGYKPKVGELETVAGLYKRLQSK